jgi:hypothetical protein
MVFYEMEVIFIFGRIVCMEFFWGEWEDGGLGWEVMEDG